jgi:hypothetical protein
LTVSPTAQTTPLVDSIKQQTKSNNKTTKNKQKKVTKTKTVLAMQVKYRLNAELNCLMG